MYRESNLYANGNENMSEDLFESQIDSKRLTQPIESLFSNRKISVALLKPQSIRPASTSMHQFRTSQTARPLSMVIQQSKKDRETSVPSRVVLTPQSKGPASTAMHQFKMRPEKLTSLHASNSARPLSMVIQQSKKDQETSVPSSASGVSQSTRSDSMTVQHTEYELEKTVPVRTYQLKRPVSMASILQNDDDFESDNDVSLFGLFRHVHIE